MTGVTLVTLEQLSSGVFSFSGRWRLLAAIQAFLCLTIAFEASGAGLPKTSVDPTVLPSCGIPGRLGVLFVDPQGQDDEEGTEAHPVASLARAVALSEGEIGRTIYLRGGLYALTETVLIGPSNEGLSVRACSGETPVLERLPVAAGPLMTLSRTRDVTIDGLTFGPTAPDGTALWLDDTEECLIAHNRIDSAGTGMLLSHTRRTVVQHNTIQNSALSGIELKDDSDGNGIDSNAIDGAGAPETHGGGIFLHGASRNLIIRNRVTATAGMGIGIANWDDATINLGNAVIGNAVLRTNLTAQDSGAIYLLGRSQLETATRVEDNWIDTTGAPDRHSVGIYLDDSMSGVRVTGNVVRHAGSDAVQIHGGSHNTVWHNLLDLGDSQASAVLFQAAPADTNPNNRQEGNEIRGNLILTSGDAPKLFVNLDGGQPLVTGNVFHHARAPQSAGGPDVQDQSPIYADPGFRDPVTGDYAFDDPDTPARLSFPPLSATPHRP